MYICYFFNRSADFHNFLQLTLNKDPNQRPSMVELLDVRKNFNVSFLIQNIFKILMRGFFLIHFNYAEMLYNIIQLFFKSVRQMFSL